MFTTFKTLWSTEQNITYEKHTNFQSLREDCSLARQNNDQLQNLVPLLVKVRGDQDPKLVSFGESEWSIKSIDLHSSLKSLHYSNSCFNFVNIRCAICKCQVLLSRFSVICSKSHDFLAVFALAHSKINQIA